jgi:phosphatidylglycerol:prolipoprotein diacylglycerol transferase
MRPILFHLPFGYPLYSYGLMLTTSVLVGRLIALRLAERARIKRALADRCAMWTMIGAVLGARLLFVVTNPGDFRNPMEIFRLADGGVVAYGGFLGGLVAAILFCRANKMPLLVWADCVVPALCLGLAITRIGCFLGGCDFGRPWEGPWAVRFPQWSPAYTQQVKLGQLLPFATESLPVHPTQLYESLAGVALLLLILAIRRQKRSPGYTLAVFAMGYGVLRFLIEIVRDDPGRGSIGALSTSQFIAVVTFVAAGALLFNLGNSAKSLHATAR